MSKFQPTAEQDEAIGRFLSGSDLVVRAGAGCLAGSTLIRVNRAGKGSAMSLAHVVAQVQGDATMTRTLGGQSVTQAAKPWDPDIPTMVAYAADQVVRLGRVADAWCSGEQEVFDVTTGTGRTIRATAKHPFLTVYGWRHLADLAPGIGVAVNTGRSARGRGPRSNYRYRDTRCHPHQVRRSAVRQRYGVAEHRLVVEAEWNGLDLPEYLAVLRRPVAPEGLLFVPRDQHVHHVYENTQNNARSTWSS
jgi:hypothetical protein